jgi:hypothetical protein
VRGIFVADPTTEDPGSPPSHELSGEVEVRAVGPAASVLWLRRLALGDGAAVTWASDHGEEALYVVSGVVDVGGRDAPAGGALVVEGAARARAVAVGPTEVVHVGRRDGGGGDGTEVHVIGPGGTHVLEEPGRLTRFFADSRCPTCSVTLFLTGRDGAYESAPHSHSADELIHVLDGELHLGRTVLGPSSTLGVEADRRYGFRSPGFRFLNYRPGPSWLTRARRAGPIEEGPEAAGLREVGDLR